MRGLVAGLALLAFSPVAHATPVGGPIVTLVKHVRGGVVNIRVPTQGGAMLGTGFVISGTGDVVTNNHVVSIDGKDAGTIIVALADGRRLRGKLVARDPRTDLALLTIPSDRLSPLTLGNSDEVEVGEQVVAIGEPLGLEFSVTSGIVSATHRRGFKLADADTYADFIQTDAAINHGNSGGPLFNLRGEVVGVNSAAQFRGQNLGFVIPINVVKRVAAELRKFGKVQRGWLGFSVKPPSTDPFVTPQGAVIDTVVPDSPAARAGLKPGDLVVKFDAQRVEDEQHLRWLCADAGIGRIVELDVRRGGNHKALKLVSVAQPE